MKWIENALFKTKINATRKMYKGFILVLLIPCWLFAQEISIESKFRILNDSIVVFNRDEVLKIPLDNLSSVSRHPLYYHSNVLVENRTAENSDFFESRIKNTSKNIYFLNSGGGEVFLYRNDSILRIDNNYNHRMQVGSAIFAKNDTLFKYGGYGFWEARNLFTYFDEATDNWKAVPPLASKKFPLGSTVPTVSIKNNEAIVVGGKTVDENDLTKRYYNTNVWKFNFTNGMWSYLGKQFEDLSSYFPVFNIDEQMVFMNSSTILVINPFENSVKKYRRSIALNKLLFKGEQYGLLPEYKDGVVYYTTNINGNSAALLQASDIDVFLGTLIEKKAFYRISYPWKYLLFLSLIPMFMGVYRFVKRRRTTKNLLVFNGSSISFRGTHHSLTPEESKTIDLLLKNDIVYKADIDTIIENLQIPRLTSLKFAKKLNFKLQLILKTKRDIIHNNKSLDDKRITEYQIEKDFFEAK